ncbi:MAG TPA: SbcC/MukB-like Walker B domain-containing protein [Candidatus Paceibacterota bacterium]|nr:SbcC/MukB-like Walker B domain-containing protein [Verrucomicrobiota bacterium]HRY49000.1 SbcC/MukB-like Walker B domain-containing protein [Candidatus Paceibacterota bacterium]
MSRAIKLTRIHAINWYGYNDSLPIEGNLLLAGVTGSGKSVLMDLIMTVLVGTDTAHRHFNRSATGGQSDRTVKSYCLLDTKREENGVEQYLRSSAITYIALEFSWPHKATDEERIETWGLRIEFRNTAENQGHIKPFVVYGPLEKADFLDAERRPLEAVEFKHLVEKSRDGRLFETQDQYLRDMAIDQHLNFNRAVLSSLLPQAMSFTNLKSFDEFCRRFILPDDKLNVADVVASYRNFKAYENDLRALFDQQSRLENIRDLHREHTAAARDRVVARWLSSELAHQHAANRVREHEEHLQNERTAFAEEEARIGELDRLIGERKSRIKSEEAALKALPGGDLYLELQEQKKRLVAESSRLRDVGNTVDSALRNRVQKARQWLKEVQTAPLSEPMDTAPMEAAIKKLEGCAKEQTEPSLAGIGSGAGDLKAALSRAIGPTERKLRDIRDQKGLLRDEVTLLANGQLPFPTTVLNILNQNLPAGGRTPPAQPLCKLCEVADEEWRAAIEVAFNRKFAIVVSDADYPAAVKIYQGLQAESPRESLIHPGKALRLARPVKPGSLAEKLRAEHPVARAIVSNLFGELMCVQHVDDLSNQDFAIHKDGFMTRGAFVERRRYYDGMPFVGLRGLEKQLALKRGLLADVESQERQLAPVVNAIQGIIDHAIEFIPAHASLVGDLREAQRLPDVEAQLKQVLARLNSIDRGSFEEKEKQLAALNSELTTWETEQRRLLQSQKRGDIKRLENELHAARERETSTLRAFERLKQDIEDISVHATRLNEWRAEITSTFPSLDAAASEFGRLEREADKQAEVGWEKLKAARHELALAYRKFEDLTPEYPSNEPWTKLLSQIAEANIPDYKTKAEAERKRWEQLFRSNVLQRMDQALRRVNDTIVLLNDHLKQPIGNDRYQIERRQNPDFRLYRQLIDLNSQFQDDGLFYQAVQGQLQDALDHFLSVLTSEQDSAEAAHLLDYRQYFDYDLLVWDSRDAQSTPVSVDKQSGKMSGGENQSPYFVAILASYLRAYKRHERRWNDPSLALVPIDEAFSKMDTGRIKDCIEAIKALDLQGSFSMSTGNVPAAFSLCDQLIVVSRHEERRGNRPHIRNVPVNILRDSEEGREWMNEHA